MKLMYVGWGWRINYICINGEVIILYLLDW